MLAWLISDAGMSALGLLGGWIMRYQSTRQDHFFRVLEARESSMNAAAERTKDGGTWMRRAIYFFIVTVFLIALLAPFLDQNTVVEIEVQKGILFWKRMITEFVTIDGVLLPADVRKAFLLLCGFYLGQGVK